MQNVNLIVAFAKNLVIGKDGSIPWTIPEDLTYFKNVTEGHYVVMGRKTYFSLPENVRPLPNRKNIVITNTPSNFQNNNNVLFVTMEEADNIIRNLDDKINIFIAGGESIYQHYMPQCSKILTTQIDMSVKGDTKFPFIPSYFSITEYSCLKTSTTGQQYRFVTYQRDKRSSHPEIAYLQMMRHILEDGNIREDRTGTGTKSIFGHQLRFDISKSVPLITTKFVPWKMCIQELLWFAQGRTNAKVLQEQGIKIWDGNTTREFLDKRGLCDLPEGDVGALYGFQWRHFGASYKTCNDKYDGDGFDQLKYIENELLTNPYSRRIFMSAWNAIDLDKMALCPCHVSCQFYVEDNGGEKHLSCHMYQRSVDTFLGEAWNIFSYTVLTYILAKRCNMQPKDLIISTGDTHIYLNHIEQVNTQLHREPLPQPILVISDAIQTKDWNNMSIADFELVGYTHHPAIKAEMSV